MHVAFLIIAAVFAFLVPPTAPAAVSPAAEHKFVSHMVKTHGFDKDRLERLLGQAVHKQKIIDAITRPAEALPWHRYRRIFLKDDRIRGGVAYWKEHVELLERAQATYGVPAEIIVAIIGVETKYGANTGSYRVIDALKTLGFGYPRRADFFRGELEEFLLMAREEELDPLKPLGSYAGAMGKPQFIPSSFRAYAIDFDGDGKRDLWNGDADTIGSIANYLAKHGWVRDGGVAFEVDTPPEHQELATTKARKPDRQLGELRVLGFSPPDGLPPDSLATLMRFEQSESDEFWLGLNNFYTITRYNHSNLYAMAVFQLSEAVLAARNRGG
ncbi:MAG: lytic murein transglycosylase B [Pseudomonadota bacterium]